jgi:outer membrane immunogenic protein
MKKLLLASATALALSAGSAFAADLAPEPYYKAPPPPLPPPVSWTGCYVNGGVGYGLYDQSHYSYDTVTGTILSSTTNSAGEGWLGRVGAGCDYQASRFVFGVFGDYDFTDLSGTFGDPGLLLSGTEKETGAWAFGGRVGYLVTPSLLTYFDGGYSQARFNQVNLSLSVPPFPATGFAIPSQTYGGWFLGGGTEYALSGIVPISGLFWRTEYRFASYNSANAPIVCVSVAPGCPAVGFPVGFGEHLQKDVQTITSGIVWRFNFGGPLGGGD